MNKLVFFYFTDYDISLDNGPGINEREFITSLACNANVNLYCFITHPRYPGKLNNISNLSYISKLNIGVLGFLTQQVEFIICALRVSRQAKPILLIVRPMKLNLAPLFISWILNCPLAIKSLQEYSAYGVRHHSWTEQILFQLSLPFFKLLLSKATLLDTPSECYAKWNQQKFSVPSYKLKVLPNGVNTSKFNPIVSSIVRKITDLPQKTKIIGYVGAFNKYRHLEDLINAIFRLSRSYNIEYFKLVLIGDGYELENLHNRINQLCINDYVLFIGKVNYEDVPLWINSFDVAIDLTLVELQISDGNKIFPASYSQKIAQYLACGRPVIVAHSTDNKFIENKNLGWLVKANDSDSIADGIASMFKLNEREWKELSQRCRSYATQYLDNDILTKKRITYWKTTLSSKNHIKIN